MNNRYGRSVDVDVFAPNTANGATKYDDYAAGDFVTLRLTVPSAGSYAVTITAKMMNDRGQVQLAVADTLAGPYTNVDTPKDE